MRKLMAERDERNFNAGILHGLKLALSSYKRLKKHPQALDYETLLRVAIKRRKEASRER